MSEQISWIQFADRILCDYIGNVGISKNVSA